MPRKSASKPQQPEIPTPPYATDADTPWGGYCNLNLTEDDKLAFSAWRDMNADYLDGMLADVVGEGVQFSMKYQPKQQGFSCTLTSRPHPELNMRCCMTSWGNSPTEALHISLYKWVQVLGKDMSDYRPSTNTFARWG